MKLLIYDFEVFKYDWMITWLDTQDRKLHYIVNDKAKFEKFYEYYKNWIWVGYNSRTYDQWIAKAILCGFNPYEMSDWIIRKDRKGFEFSKMLCQFPIMNYDCSFRFRSLKELEAFMGHNIKETSVPFDIDRRLTLQEIYETLEYCKHDVTETFEVFVETSEEFESHVGLIKEFDLPMYQISKTKVQLSALILGAVKHKWDDEFDIQFPDTLQLNEHQWIKDWFVKVFVNKNYDEFSLTTTINGVEHTLGIGGLHGAIPHYMGTGIYIMADVASYYPSMMIEYDFLSRNVKDRKKFGKIRDDRLVMKANHDPRQKPRKIVLNGTYGASKDPYNNLYDPRQANNICVAGQLLLIDLLEKLEGKCQLIQSNTDGILVKVNNETEKSEVESICSAWSKRTRMGLEFSYYSTVYQKDVNNYILLDDKGKAKRKGAWVKKLSPLDNDLPIVNKAVVEYFINHIAVENTIMAATQLIDFQKVVKVGSKYEYAKHNGQALSERVHRCFASRCDSDGILYKKHKQKTGFDKIAGTPEHCFIVNENITNASVPDKLDRQWYINLAKERVKDFC